MKKKLGVLLVVVLILATASISALAGDIGEKQLVQGIWCYVPTGVNPEVVLPTDNYMGDPNKGFWSSAYLSEWYGSFSGPSTDYGLLVAHGADPMVFIGTSSFTEVLVGDKVGGLEMDAFGDRATAYSDWRGKWKITSGSGELKGLVGEGRFWGPGWMPPDGGGAEECPPGYGLIYYSGRIIFR